MDLKSKAKEELESRLNRVENFIADKGLGAGYLTRAKKVQRNLNLAIVFGSVVAIAGIAAWAVNAIDSDDEE